MPTGSLGDAGRREAMPVRLALCALPASGQRAQKGHGKPIRRLTMTFILKRNRDFRPPGMFTCIVSTSPVPPL
jgi:hypothetical protein